MELEAIKVSLIIHLEILLQEEYFFTEMLATEGFYTEQTKMGEELLQAVL